MLVQFLLEKFLQNKLTAALIFNISITPKLKIIACKAASAEPSVNFSKKLFKNLDISSELNLSLLSILLYPLFKALLSWPVPWLTVYKPFIKELEQAFNTFKPSVRVPILLAAVCSPFSKVILPLLVVCKPFTKSFELLFNVPIPFVRVPSLSVIVGKWQLLSLKRLKI